MQLTRRFWAASVTSIVLALEALVVEQPLLLVGATGIAAWLLARQYGFVREVRRTIDAIEITQELDHSRVRTNAATTVTVGASLPFPARLGVGIEANPPAAASGSTVDERSGRIATGDRDVTIRFSPVFPVAGRLRFRPPTVSLDDQTGLFTTSLELGPEADLTVDPRVGARSSELFAGYGEDPLGYRGVGNELGDVRAYQPGDPAHLIEWNATARLNQLFVRELEMESDRSTVIVLDHSRSMWTGAPGRTKLDYGRQAALSVVSSVRAANEPLGLYTVTDDGLTTQLPPRSGPQDYDLIATRLYEITPGPTTERSPTVGRWTRRTPGRRRRALDALQNDSSAFGERLRPYFATTGSTVRHVEGDPLYRTVRTFVDRRQSMRTVFVSDGTNRRETLEAVKRAVHGDNTAVVFLAPTVLFDPDALGDIEHAYQRYLRFEEFAGTLERIGGVSVFELAPGDRADGVLDQITTRAARARVSQ